MKLELLAAAVLLLSCDTRGKQCKQLLAATEHGLEGRTPMQLATGVHTQLETLNAVKDVHETLKKPFDEYRDSATKLESTARTLDADSHFVVDTLADAGLKPEPVLQPLYALVGQCMAKTAQVMAGPRDAGASIGADCERVLTIYEQASHPEPGVSVVDHVAVCIAALEDAGVNDEVMRVPTQRLLTALHDLDPQLHAIAVPAKDIFDHARASTEGMKALNEGRADATRKQETLRSACKPK